MGELSLAAVVPINSLTVTFLGIAGALAALHMLGQIDSRHASHVFKIDEFEQVVIIPVALHLGAGCSSPAVAAKIIVAAGFVVAQIRAISMTTTEKK
jgi:hypothetical protein